MTHRKEREDILRVYGVPVERPSPMPARLSGVLLIAGLLLATVGPAVGYGILDNHHRDPFLRLVGNGLFSLWPFVLLLGAGVGLWGARRDGTDDGSRRRGLMNLITLGVVGAIWLLLFGPTLLPVS